ncbi:hypothetical protein D1872_173310 [compost metagenome]|jgi:hypothetical protein
MPRPRKSNELRVNDTFYLPLDLVDRLKEEKNKSELVEKLLKKYYEEKDKKDKS